MNGIESIAAERQRQIDEEGWTVKHDDQHTDGALAAAAACYANPFHLLIGDGSVDLVKVDKEEMPIGWPCDWNGWWKPKDQRSNLVRAGALIAAEIDRLDRKGHTP